MPDRCGDTLGISGNEDRVSSSDAIWAENSPHRRVNSGDLFSF